MNCGFGKYDVNRSITARVFCGLAMTLIKLRLFVSTAVAKSIGSDIHFVFAKLAGPWHKMTANTISVSHIISTGEIVN